MKAKGLSIVETSLNEIVGGSIEPPIDLLLPENGVVRYYMNNPPYYDEPKVYGFATLLNKSSSVKKYHQRVAPEIFIGFAGGASLDKNRALWKVIGESVERFALFMNERESIKGSFEKLLSKGKNLLDPDKIFYSTIKNQPQSKKKTILDWISGYDLTNQKKCLIPTQLVAVPYWDSGKEIIWRAPITTGAATGSSIESAIFSGLCEVIERDAFMVSWLKQLQLKKITFDKKEIASVKDNNYVLLTKTLESIHRYNLFPEFYLLPNDTELPSVMCILKDKTKIGPPLTIGLDTDLSIIKTMLGALEECLQLRPWVRQLYNSNKDKPKKKISFDIGNLEERASLWTNNRSINILNKWLDKSETIALNNLLKKKKPKRLQDIISSISKNNSTVYFTDLTQYTPKIVSQKNLFAVKVIVPEYQPLYLIERFADHVFERLESAENRLQSKSLLRKNSLQKYPHPML